MAPYALGLTEDAHASSSRSPALITATLAAWLTLPAIGHAQQAVAPVSLEVSGSEGRNASRFRSSTRGGSPKDLAYTLASNQSINTQSYVAAAIALTARAGKGGDGHDGIIWDSAGSMGGSVGRIALEVAGSVTQGNASATGHGIAVTATGGNSGSRMKGGTGGGSGGMLGVSLNNASVTTYGRGADGLQVRSTGGKGGSGFEAAGIRWSASSGGAGGQMSLGFSGSIDATGSGITASSRGGVGGNISGGVIQTAGSSAGTGGHGGEIIAALSGKSNGAASTIIARGGSGVSLISAGGDGGQVTGSSWFNGADGGDGGVGGNISAQMDKVQITARGDGVSGVLLQSDGATGSGVVVPGSPVAARRAKAATAAASPPPWVGVFA